MSLSPRGEDPKPPIGLAEALARLRVTCLAEPTPVSPGIPAPSNPQCRASEGSGDVTDDEFGNWLEALHGPAAVAASKAVPVSWAYDKRKNNMTKYTMTSSSALLLDQLPNSPPAPAHTSTKHLRPLRQEPHAPSCFDWRAEQANLLLPPAAAMK